VYAEAVAAGFNTAQATIMTAIAGAESGFDDAAAAAAGSDTRFGLFGITTARTATGSGSARDVAALSGSDRAQAQAAFGVSRGGEDFTAWPSFTSGAYQSYLPAAQQAAVKAGGGNPLPFPLNLTIPVTVAGLDVAGAAAGGVIGGVRQLVLTGGFVGLGLVLLVAGAIVIVRPGRLHARAMRAAAAVTP